MLKRALIVLIPSLALSTTPVAAATQEEKVMEYAHMFGFISAGADRCRNLTLARIPEVRKAVRVYRQSESRAVRDTFYQARNAAIRKIRQKPQEACSVLATNFPWFFEETRDK